MEKMKKCWLLLSIMLACSDAFKILVMFPMPLRSHGNLGDGVVRYLLSAGHEVTYISPFTYQDPPANLRSINVSCNFDLMPKDLINIKHFMDKTSEVMNIGFLTVMMTEMVKNTIANNDVQKLLNDPKEQFDVVIAEWMFTELPAGIASVFDCPLIWSSSLEAHWLILRLIDEPSNPAYTTDVMSTYSPPLNFIQRVNELWIQLKIQFLNYMSDVCWSWGYFRRCPLYHIDDNVKPLPENLKKLLDNANNGVIYFSMGSNLKSKDMPDELKASLLKMFGTLKQTILWKFEEVLPNLPENVHILEWAPQQAILSHPNLAVFITHGGLLSTTEAVHFGVPIIGIPVFADQFINVDKAVDKGFGLKVDLSYTMADELKKMIIEVTTNSRYVEKAKELSFIHHDRPVKPGQELVHWVNHVVNTRGARHLRSPAMDLPFYKKKFLDLAVLIAIVLLVVYVLLKRACVCIVCSLANRGTGRKKKNN